LVWRGVANCFLTDHFHSKRTGGNRPAGSKPGGQAMFTHLLLLLVIMVILGATVKITIGR
jgi:hypothetical protein